MLQDKKLCLESRLRESFHVLRLSNRLCWLCHTVFSPLSRVCWVHSGENNESRVVGTRHAGQAQMCQGPWQQRQGEGGGNGQVANLPFCWAVKQAPVLHMARGEGEFRTTHISLIPLMCWMLEYYLQKGWKDSIHLIIQDLNGINIMKWQLGNIVFGPSKFCATHQF